jgi:hypothetical protein
VKKHYSFLFKSSKNSEDIISKSYLILNSASWDFFLFVEVAFFSLKIIRDIIWRSISQSPFSGHVIP